MCGRKRVSNVFESLVLTVQKQAESLKKTVLAEAGVFIWYLNRVYVILNNIKIEKYLNIFQFLLLINI